MGEDISVEGYSIRNATLLIMRLNRTVISYINNVCFDDVQHIVQFLLIICMLDQELNDFRT